MSYIYSVTWEHGGFRNQVLTFQGYFTFHLRLGIINKVTFYILPVSA
jgi:hypothetical protein